jgi:NADH:ubiquinone oxidoreductase subunit 4 (subunit M)
VVFTRRNYVLIVAGVLAVIIGYALMAIENELYGFISLYVAPIIILGGYVEIIYGIMWRSGDGKPSPRSEATAQ